MPAHGLERLGVTREHLAAVCVEFGVRELAAFGSVLREDFDAESDIDLLVEFAPERKAGLFDLIRLQHRFEELLGRKVDLVPKSGLKPVLRERVLAAARTVYGA